MKASAVRLLETQEFATEASEILTSPKAVLKGSEMT